MGKTSKPLDLIVDERLYDLPEIQALGEQGHTIKKLLSHGYDAIIAPKAFNLSQDDVTNSPKLLEVVLKTEKDNKYKKEKADVVEDTQASAGEDAPGDTKEDGATKPVPRKRKPRAKKRATPANEQGGGSDPSPDKPADTASGGK